MITFKLTEKQLTEEEVQEFENSQGISLPDSYRKHILENNGGVLLDTYFEGNGISFFYPIKYGDDTLEECIEDLSDVLPENFLPFAQDSGGNTFCIDLSDGKIYLWLVQEEIEDSIVLLASSFNEFINGLSEDEE